MYVLEDANNLKLCIQGVHIYTLFIQKVGILDG